jgi:hypothetical protein
MRVAVEPLCTELEERSRLETLLAVGRENFRYLLAGWHAMDEHFPTAPMQEKQHPEIVKRGESMTEKNAGQTHPSKEQSAPIPMLPIGRSPFALPFLLSRMRILSSPVSLCL